MTTVPLGAAQSGHSATSYGSLVRVWLALVLLTAALVGITATRSAAAAVVAMLVITPVKASLVFYHFMQLKNESTAFKYMVFVALAALIVFLTLLFADYLFR